MPFHSHAPLSAELTCIPRLNAVLVLPPTTAASSTPSAPAKTLNTSPRPPAVSPRSALRTMPRMPSSSPRSFAAVSASTACPRPLPALPVPVPLRALRLRPPPHPTLLRRPPRPAATRAARPLPLRLVVLRLFTTRMHRSLRLLVLLLLRSWRKFDYPCVLVWNLELHGRTAKDGWILFDDIMNLGSI